MLPSMSLPAPTSPIHLAENLLNEFYLPATSNWRKREIEGELMSFKNMPSAWQLCLRVTTEFDANQFLWFFCTSTLEHAITRRWQQLSAGDRSTLRDTLWNTYANLNMRQGVPRRQRDTLAHLIAMMGKREFSHENPSYMKDCLALVKANFTLGVTLLRLTSEEVVNQRDSVNTERRKYFHDCVLMVLPEVTELLTKYLIISTCYLNGKDLQTLDNSLIDYTLLPSLPNDSSLGGSLVELLNCVQHLVSWIPIELISDYFLVSILELSQWRSAHSEVALAALHVLNELLYLPKMLLYPATVMNGVNNLLQQHNALKCRSEMYDDKFRELLRLYTNRYWSKLLQENDIFKTFLEALYHFTLAKHGALDFAEKLEVWTPILKGMVSTSKLEFYGDLVHALVSEIMQRTRFEFNKSELEILDNEVLEDNQQTEWQQYLNQCFECVALIAESRPQPVLQQIYNHWLRSYAHLLSLEATNGCDNALSSPSKLKLLTCSEHLRDLASICQVLVRITPLLAEEQAGAEGAPQTGFVSLLTDNMLVALNILSSQKLLAICNSKPDLRTDLIELYAQILMAIRSLLLIARNLKCDQKLKSLIEIVGNILLPSSDTAASPLIYTAASQLLLCIASVIRPKIFFDVRSINRILLTGPRMSHLPREALANVYISLTSSLVLPWQNVAEQQQNFAPRLAALRKYLESIAQNLLELDLRNNSMDLQAQATKVGTVVVTLLPPLKTLVDFFLDTNNTAKDMLASVLKPIIMQALMVCDAYGLSHVEISTAIADFCLSMLRTFHSQLGAAFVKDLITLYISVSNREHHTHGRHIVLEKVLQMFQLIVEQPGSASMSLLPAILDFTIGQILPVLHLSDVTDKSDISLHTFALFDSVLNCKWQYFYKSFIQPNNALELQNFDNLHPEHFIAILNAYGEVLITGNDPNVVHNVLQSLQSVNERWNLYNRALFRENLLSSFQSALLKILMSGEAALHYDLLINTFYTMIQIDKTKLSTVFNGIGYQTNQQLEDLFCATDIPTFSQKLAQILQDIQCNGVTGGT